MNVLVTGSSGLIGSEAVEYYDREGHQVIGFDNNMAIPLGTSAAYRRLPATFSIITWIFAIAQVCSIYSRVIPLI